MLYTQGWLAGEYMRELELLPSNMFSRLLLHPWSNQDRAQFTKIERKRSSAHMDYSPIIWITLLVNRTWPKLHVVNQNDTLFQHFVGPMKRAPTLVKCSPCGSIAIQRRRSWTEHTHTCARERAHQHNTHTTHTHTRTYTRTNNHIHARKIE